MRPAYNKRRARSVLIVDDDAGFLHFAGSVLREDGHQVVIADSVRDGVNAIKTKKCDLILLDATLPGQTYRQALATFKGDLLLRDIPVVLVADGFTLQDKEQALACRAVDLLPRSCGAGDLSLLVYRLLEQSGG
ncbi:MAG: response regulator with CheY-like receiver domain and winged-helix DNA-binding domain [Dehalococcoidia bacterium]|nr:response regulator with CheY-like receiver domain and winged-helix DNA-binding domain [Dehalococcoidia bacterium]